MDPAAEDHDGVDLAHPVRLWQPPGNKVQDDGQRETDGEGGHHGRVLRTRAEDLAGAEAAEEDCGCEVRVDSGAGEPVWLVAVGWRSVSCALKVCIPG